MNVEEYSKVDKTNMIDRPQDFDRGRPMLKAFQ